MIREDQPQIESAAAETKTKLFDFKVLFDERLKTIRPPQTRFVLDEVGIESVKLQAPAIVFIDAQKASGQQEIWIEDPIDLRSYSQPHQEEEQHLENFINQNDIKKDISLFTWRGYVVQEDDDSLYLVLNEAPGKEIKTDIQEDRRLSLEEWVDLMKRYNIKKIIARFGVENFSEMDPEIVGLIDQDLIDKWREDDYLRTFTDKYGMTNNQFLRFRLLAKSAVEAFKQEVKKPEGNQVMIQLYNLDQLAKEVIESDRVSTE